MKCLWMPLMQGTWLHKRRKPIWPHSSTAHIVLFWRGQNTVESSTIGSESIVLRIGTELLEGLRYIYIKDDGYPNTQGPVQCLGRQRECRQEHIHPRIHAYEKAHSYYCSYHLVREATATGIIIIYHIRSEDNKADLLTKNLGGNKLKDAAQSILY